MYARDVIAFLAKIFFDEKKIMNDKPNNSHLLIKIPALIFATGAIISGLGAFIYHGIFATAVPFFGGVSLLFVVLLQRGNWKLSLRLFLIAASIIAISIFISKLYGGYFSI